MSTLNRLACLIKKPFSIVVLALCLLAPVSAIADDWVAEKLRGAAFAWNGTEWLKLSRGDVISDNRIIRTQTNGRVTFKRGDETIEVGGKTQIRIHDASRKKYTTVMQDFGTVVVEADARKVQHFSVATPFMAAVVKGTKFTVQVGRTTSSVGVERGRVQVFDNHHDTVTSVTEGQTATVQPTQQMSVKGPGEIAAVTSKSGKLVAEAQTSDAPGNSGNSNGNSGNGNSGNGNGNSGNGNGNSGNGNGNSGNNGNGNSGNNGNGNGNSGNNGNGNGNSGNNGNGNGNGNNGNGNGNS